MTDTNQFDALEWLRKQTEAIRTLGKAGGTTVYLSTYAFEQAADELEQARARIADLEAERDRLRSENEVLKADRDTWYARAVSLLWRGHADDVTAGKIQEVAQRIEKILKAAEPKGAVVATRPDTTQLVSPEAADRHT